MHSIHPPGSNPPNMSPSIPSAKLTLSCPLFAADFDPRHHGLLLVGGGGGEGRSGVGNKIASSALVKMMHYAAPC